MRRKPNRGRTCAISRIATSQRRLVRRPTAAIPRRPTELRQMTGPHAADTEGRLDPAGQLAALCGPQTFFRSASVRMCLSSDRSATTRFKPRILVFERPELSAAR